MLSLKGRYLALLWLTPLVYLPGAETIAVNYLDEMDEWYWYSLVYQYYFHLLISLGLILLVFLDKTDWRTRFGEFETAELLPAIKLTAFIFILSIAGMYLLFYPLSYVVPGFVNYWFIELPPFIFSSMGEYPVIPNLLSFASMVVLAPVTEEFLFRGLLLHCWLKKWGMKYGILMSSLLFGVVHPDPVGATAFGIAMCILYLRTQSLWLPIICHALNNLVVWFLETGNQAYYGSDYIYTLEDFQSEWYYGLGSAVIVMLWTYWYLKEPVKQRIWKLPE